MFVVRVVSGERGGICVEKAGVAGGGTGETER